MGNNIVVGRVVVITGARSGLGPRCRPAALRTGLTDNDEVDYETTEKNEPFKGPKLYVSSRAYREWSHWTDHSSRELVPASRHGTMFPSVRESGLD
jgi:hypothetical protein